MTAIIQHTTRLFAGLATIFIVMMAHEILCDVEPETVADHARQLGGTVLYAALFLTAAYAIGLVVLGFAGAVT